MVKAFEKASDKTVSCPTCMDKFEIEILRNIFGSKLSWLLDTDVDGGSLIFMFIFCLDPI